MMNRKQKNKKYIWTKQKICVKISQIEQRCKMTYLDMIMRVMGSREYAAKFALKGLANKNQINSYQPLEIQIGIEQTNSDILCTELKHGMLEYFAELLIQLDYVAYVPFGKRGTKQLEKYFEENDYKLTPKEYKKKQMLTTLKKCGIEVGKSFKERIDSYCDYLYSSKQDLSVIESVAACVRQVSGELDNLTSEKTIIGLSERDDKLEQILDNIWTRIKVSGNTKIDMNEFLPKVDENKPLNSDEKKYFEYITQLKQTKEKEEENSL